MKGIQKTIVILLVVAIIFSVSSMLITFSLTDFSFQIPKYRIVQHEPNPGNVNLYVEGNSQPSG